MTARTEYLKNNFSECFAFKYRRIINILARICLRMDKKDKKVFWDANFNIHGKD